MRAMIFRPMAIRVESVFGHLSVQGQPEPGWRKYGLPPGGCFEPEVLARLNELVGNHPGALGLELAFGRVELVCKHPGWVAFGPNGTGKLDGVKLLNGYPYKFSEGARLEVAAPARCYLALSGGIVAKNGEAEGAGRELQVGPQTGTPLSERAIFPEPHLIFRAIPGRPEFGWIFEEELIVSPQSSRAGIRLRGGEHRHDLELPSQPATFGTVQVTPGGDVIILGPDGPTLGGYPQAATVVSHDLGTLAQLKPGDRIKLRQS